MTKSSKSSDTRDQLRRLMSQHTAATVVRPIASPSVAASSAVRNVAVDVPVHWNGPGVSIHAPAVAPISAPPAVPAVKTPKAQVSKTATGVRWSLRPDASELAKIDQMILEAHQRVGQRLTISDVLRIGLLRMTKTSPITAAEIAALRATDGRRQHNQE
jgi:hypothetical protein